MEGRYSRLGQLLLVASHTRPLPIAVVAGTLVLVLVTPSTSTHPAHHPSHFNMTIQRLRSSHASLRTARFRSSSGTSSARVTVLFRGCNFKLKWKTRLPEPARAGRTQHQREGLQRVAADQRR